MIFDTFAFYVPIAVCFGKRLDKKKCIVKEAKAGGTARLKQRSGGNIKKRPPQLYAKTASFLYCFILRQVQPS